MEGSQASLHFMKGGRLAFNHITNFLMRRPSLFLCSIRLTSLCSQACLQCRIPSQSDGSYIGIKDFDLICRKLYAHGTRILILSGGEPAIHPQLEDIFATARKYRFRALSILTNLYYSEAQQERVINLSMKYNVAIHTSYDGLDETADRLRGAKNVQATVERAMNRINELRNSGLYQHKPTATVVVSALNIDQFPAILARLQGLDWNINADLYRWGSINHREQDVLKLNDTAKVMETIQLIKKAKNLKTPLWYYDGLIRRLSGKLTKQCPYLISPTFGSKFFVHENGELHTCMDKSIGNLLTEEVKDIFKSQAWIDMQHSFANCQGCWNNCYTVSSRALSYLHWPTIRQYLMMKGLIRVSTTE